MQRSSILQLALALAAAPVPASAQRAGPAAHDPARTTVERELARLAERAGAVLGVAAVHVESGRRATLNAGESFPMASVYKLPIALQLLHRVDRGELRLGEPVTLARWDYRQGHSPLRESSRGRPVTLPVERLLELMLGESDNSASDALLRLAGGPRAVTGRMRELGVAGIDVSRPELWLVANFFGLEELPPETRLSVPLLDSLAAAVPAGERAAAAARYARDARDSSTPEAMAELLVRVQRGAGLSPASHRRLMRILAATPTGAQRLRGLLPPGTPVAHKTGTMGGTVNDVGVVTLPGGAGHLAVAVFVREWERPPEEAERVIARAARVLYEHFGR